MNVFKQIAVFVLAVVFLFTSTGLVIYQIDCVCKGEQEISMYVSPETCADEFHNHHTHDFQSIENENESPDCHDCSDHMDECGCASPEVKYLRLVNQFTEGETLFLKTELTVLIPAILPLTEKKLKISVNEPDEFYIDPPPVFATSTEFLIKINKLKIPELA